MPSNWVKQPQQISAAGGRFLNGGTGDSTLGGTLTGVPSGITVSQGIQDSPGDRMVLGEEDAAALTNTTVGTLYGGLYQYVATLATSTATPTKFRAVFWNPAVANSTFQVTPDESGTMGVTSFAGVNINTLTKGNYWWIQTAGRVHVLFRTSLTGTPAAGSATYLAAAGAGADVGTFDVLDGSGNPTFTQMGAALNRYTGPAVTSPTGATASDIYLPLNRNYRW